MSDLKKLILTIVDPQAVTNVNLSRKNPSELTLLVMSGNILSIIMLADSVLVIRFETGELRIDLTSEDLNKLEFME